MEAVPGLNRYERNVEREELKYEAAIGWAQENHPQLLTAEDEPIDDEELFAAFEEAMYEDDIYAQLDAAEIAAELAWEANW
jgi:hypothetical protein